MGSDQMNDDVAAIRALVERQFASLSWDRHRAPGWDAFAADFLPGAPLYPAARPVGAVSVPAFVERMRGLSAGTLAVFDETVLGIHVRVFGNIAIAAAGAEMVENGEKVSRSVEMMLLVRDGGAWRIAAQAWDRAGEAGPLPDDLAGAPGSR